jgi:hypothetical protein
MSFNGHVVCHTCRIKLSLGKLLRDESGTQIGFDHGQFTDEQFGRLCLAFIAEHIKHDLVCLGDTRLYDMADLPIYDTLMRIGPTSPYGLANAPIQLADIDVWRVPCEPHSDRAERIHAASGG